MRMGKLFIGNFSNRSRNKTNSFHFFVLWYWFGYAHIWLNALLSKKKKLNFFYYFSFMTKLTEMFTFRNARVEFQHLSKVVIHKSHIELSFYCTLLALPTLLGHLVSLMAIPLLSISYHFAVTYFLFYDFIC